LTNATFCIKNALDSIKSRAETLANLPNPGKVDPELGCGLTATKRAGETPVFLRIRERNRMSKKLSTRHFVYHVYRDSVLVESFWTEPLSFNYLKEQARLHRTAEFRVERAETIFDSSTSPEDKNILDGLRTIKRSNAIHATIHANDRTGMDDE
jgi:hypothetical protein